MSFAILVAMLVLAWRSRRAPAATPFAYAIAALMVWTVGFAMELASTGVEAKLFWVNVQYVGIVALPVFWLQVVVTHLGYSRPRWWTLLWVVPALTLLFVWWAPGDVFYGDPSLISRGVPVPMLDYDYGWWALWVSTPYALALTIAAATLLVLAVRRRCGTSRWQAALLLASTLVPLLAELVYALGWSPVQGYNLVVPAIVLSGVMMAVALFRYHLFDVAPLAREVVVESMRDPVIVLDERRCLVDFNAAAGALLPALRPEAIGGPLAVVLEGSPNVLDMLQHGSSSEREVTLRSGDDARQFSLELSPVRAARGHVAGTVAVFHDITERVELFERVKELARLDGLTNIFNRRHFFELAAAELQRARRHDASLSLILFDLDHFKEINDNHGHLRGDEVLRAVARACGDRLRSFDIFGRYGGEEFAVLLPDVDPDGALAVAERLRRGIAEVQREVGVEVSASFGVASVLTTVGVGLDDLLALADEALYRAKSRGRDRVEEATCLPAPEQIDV